MHTTSIPYVGYNSSVSFKMPRSHYFYNNTMNLTEAMECDNFFEGPCPATGTPVPAQALAWVVFSILMILTLYDIFKDAHKTARDPFFEDEEKSQRPSVSYGRVTLPSNDTGNSKRDPVTFGSVEWGVKAYNFQNDHPRADSTFMKSGEPYAE